MATRPALLRTCLALLLAVTVAFAGVGGLGKVQAGSDPHTPLSQLFSDEALHAGMAGSDSGASDQSESCGSGASCCPGQNHSCAALPGSHLPASRGLDTGAESLSGPPLDRPLRPPFRPPIA